MLKAGEFNVSLFNNAYKGRKVLITGHTGFKGSWLASWLTKLGAEVCGYSNGIPTTPSLFEAASIQKNIRHELGDIRDVARLRALCLEYKPDFVFHLAAQAIVSTSYAEPFETFGVNAMGTAAVLEALRLVDWPCVAVVITSDKAYDNVEWPWGYRETDRLGGKDIYSGSKGAAELVFNSYFHSFFAKPDCPVRLATARAGNVIGGGDWAVDRIVADCIRAWCNGKPVDLRSPNATRPWQHVLEPLSGYLTLASKMVDRVELHGESFNFGPRAEQNATVLELLRSLAKIWGFSDPGEGYVVTNNSPFQESSLLKLNIDKALLELRWEPNLSYSECMEITGVWYRDVQKADASASELTSRQIAEYERVAGERQRTWTQ
ncbi:CDP-glucose 4,6-dehydratase [Paraburkholderia sp. UCT31]|nr:CDP-glucose 4,6-dehydratase [Paraburkholderia sp. UCT31]